MFVTQASEEASLVLLLVVVVVVDILVSVGEAANYSVQLIYYCRSTWPEQCLDRSYFRRDQYEGKS